ncbi:hypothetical protein CHLNCDRAFT_137360 [Chlorella variabilis]|uniref:Cytochrome b561 domain-containing protein n=1 Tax=Chlorella variabilis TaxID=554065 RepID=E1ZM94_CHLVA|nr:hypothetical protein CHLNCDRAFT_137360 [Chlorella variabilis]EFN52967.1 hypothetical protein CHLNCDRAFT_137360 [Chlorella variabilis]|eukprot:XP_005845069.1 hypothetical protein CHLNCDRAFT_137360 [Chlorella variabilis]
MATAMFQGGAGLGLRVVSTAQRVTCVARPKSARIVPRPAKKEVQLNSLAPVAALAAINPLADFLQDGCGYLGWRIRLSDSAEEVAVAQDLHPKLAIGMTLFFALGGLGGSMSVLMQGKSLWSSSHFTTAVIGLILLALQGMTSAFFEDDPSARGIHAYLGSAILALFLYHGTLGLQLGLSL